MIYDMDNEDNHLVMNMKNSIINDETMRSFIKTLNEQVRGKENERIKMLLKNFEGFKSSSTGSRSLQMVKFCDKLVRTIQEYKKEISSILPPKDKIVSLIFQMFITKCNYKMSPNLIKFLNLCEAFLWIQYIYVKIKQS